jgi:two-component system, cell cycle sensor histidine kinase and response regulator CckA
MIGQILDFTRSSTIERGPMNLLSMVKEMIKLLQQIFPENIAIHLHTDANEYQILADPTRLQQALMNMALNARDAMPQGGDLRFSFTSLTLAPDETPPLPDLAAGRWLRVAISDTGDGIQPAHLPRIFDPFFTTKQPGKGTGLGLPQVHGIIKQHEGSITAESAPGLGTTFMIYFPLLARLSDQSRLPEANSAKPPRGNETILLVEDNAQLRASLRETLADLGYTILEAENGLAALEILNDGRTNIHLVISDLVMPEMSGLELYHATEKQRRDGLKILLMSGYPLEENQAELNQIGWLSKPFDAHQIAQKVRASLSPT